MGAIEQRGKPQKHSWGRLAPRTSACMYCQLPAHNLHAGTQASTLVTATPSPATLPTGPTPPFPLARQGQQARPGRPKPRMAARYVVQCRHLLAVADEARLVALPSPLPSPHSPLHPAPARPPHPLSPDSASRPSLGAPRRAWQHAMLYSAAIFSPSLMRRGLSRKRFTPVPGSVRAFSKMVSALSHLKVFGPRSLGVQRFRH